MKPAPLVVSPRGTRVRPWTHTPPAAGPNRAYICLALNLRCTTSVPRTVAAFAFMLLTWALAVPTSAQVEASVEGDGIELAPPTLEVERPPRVRRGPWTESEATADARRTSRWLLTLGGALTVSGAILASTMGRVECYDEPGGLRGARVGGMIMFGAGLSFAMGGGVWLSTLGPSPRRGLRAARVRHALYGLLFGTLLTGISILVNLEPWIGCVSS